MRPRRRVALHMPKNAGTQALGGQGARRLRHRGEIYPKLGMSTLHVSRALAGWLALALVVVLPRGGLTGNADVDVWNHAWGLWWVADALSQGQMPWFTKLLGAPEGGVLYYIDAIGALSSLPLTLTLGPHFAYEALVIARVALAGFFACELARELWGDGPHAVLAGVAFATCPMLLCELQNGITEVVAIYWIPAALLAAYRAVRLATPAAWALLGGVLGLSVLANFYYGLVTVGLAAGVWAVRSRSPRGLLLAAGVLFVIALPGAWALRASLADPAALVMRSQGLNRELAAHNAVDPQVFWTPGSFVSVDLAGKYGEAFRHTGYLRWSVLLLAGAGALLRLRGNRRYTGELVAFAALSVVLALGPQLWVNGRFVLVNQHPVFLPFAHLQRLVPELAITHPLRLGVAAQALFAVLAARALVGRSTWTVAALCVVVAAEGMFGSLAIWPLPEASPRIPAIYHEIAQDPDSRGVLDLPGDVGTRMATSQYFWFQTVHGHAVPYKPDARANDNGDPTTFALLPDRMDRSTKPAVIDVIALDHLRQTYGWVIIHPDFEARAGLPASLRSTLEPALGAPIERDGLLVWRLPPR